MHDIKLQFNHLLVKFERRIGDRDFTVLMGQISLIHLLNQLPGQIYEMRNERIVTERLSKIINLNAPVNAFWVRKEKDGLKLKGTRTKVEKLAFGRFPDAVKLRGNQRAVIFPDCPANLLFTSIRGDMLWNNGETFVEWLKRNWPAIDKHGLGIRADLAAE